MLADSFGRVTPGFIPVGGDADAARAAAAQRAVKEQAPGSEFTVVIPEDLQDCLDRLDEIRTEMGEMSSKMYGVMMGGSNSISGYSGPPHAQRLAIQMEMDRMSDEESLIQRRIMELQWVLPPVDADGDLKEDEDETGDETQVLETFQQPASGNVKKIIGADKK